MLLDAVTAELVDVPVVVLDLRQLSFCDIAGVHAVHRTFELAGADRLLQIFGTPASGFAR